MTRTIEKEPFPPRWAFFVAALMILAGIGWNIYMQYSTTADKNTAQANSRTLAQDIQTVCDAQGKLLVDDRDLCAKAEKVQQNPTEAIPGPKGDPGNDGRDGVDGLNGAPGPQGVPGDPGKDGAAGPPGATGPEGPPGADGLNGTDGLNGAPGPAGAAGADGAPGPQGEQGPAGPAGTDGAPGADGQSPSSFTFTDKTGTTYTCTPNPPGSTDYTCTYDDKKEPVTP